MKTVYLDTSMWIELERAWSDPNQPAHTISRHILDRAENGDVCLPLSLVHAFEILKHFNPLRRRQLWKFAMRLSGCLGILNSQAVLPSLVEESVCKVFGAKLNRENTIVFTRSGLFGLDLKGHFPLTELALQTREGWERFWLEMPEQTHTLAFHGLRQLEEEFIARRNVLKSNWQIYDNETRRRAHIARLFFDMQEVYFVSMARIGRGREDIESLVRNDVLRLITEVPPLDVEVCLAVQHQQQWDRPETINDVRDVSHLCMAIPYCDVVITERYWVDKIKREKLDERYGTKVSSDLSFLLQI